jgi:large subunit ribosomal protein L4
VFGPQPRSYGYQLPRKVERAALREALTAKLREGALTVVETIALDTPGTKAAAELIARLGAKGRILVIDVAPDAAAVRSFRNLARTELRATGHVSARDVVGAGQVIVTRAAIERLQTVLGGDAGDADAASPAETQESGS